MASEFSRQLIKKVDNLPLMPNRSERAELAADTELTEVREALGHLLKVAKDAKLPMCSACKRALALYEKLKV